MKSLLLLMVVPVVLGGGPEFMKMWSDMEKEMGQAMPEPSPSDTPMAGDGSAADMPSDEMMKQMQKMMGWNAAKQAEAKQGWGVQQMNGWGEQQMNGWGEQQMNGWGEQQMSGWSDKEKAKKMIEAFQAYMKAKTEEAKAAKEAEQKAQMKQAVMSFQEYMHKKEYEEKQAEHAKQALKKKMMELKMKHMLSEKLSNMTVEYAHQKHMFKAGITHHFMDFCQTCESKKSVLIRLKDGSFGDVAHMPYGGAGNGTDGGSSNNTGSGSFNGTDRGSSNGTDRGYSNGTDVMSNNRTSSYDYDAAHHEQMKQEFVRSLMQKEHEEQVEFVMNYLIEAMCTASEQFLVYLAECEAEYARQMHYYRT